MKIELFILLSVLIINLVYASCSEGQIDINTADKKEITKIIYIGNARAEQIISMRPFESVDDLIDINGIGEITLERIKQQGLACVGNEIGNEENKNEQVVEDKDESDSSINEKVIGMMAENKHTEVNVIKLEKDINTEKTGWGRNKYAIAGLIGFCVLLAGLFLFKFRRRKYKNEFEE